MMVSVLSVGGKQEQHAGVHCSTEGVLSAVASSGGAPGDCSAMGAHGDMRVRAGMARHDGGHGKGHGECGRQSRGAEAVQRACEWGWQMGSVMMDGGGVR